MSQLTHVWVLSDNAERYAELLSGARLWGQQVHAIVYGAEQVKRVQSLGADSVIVLEPHSELQRIENFAETLAARIGQDAADQHHYC